MSLFKFERRSDPVLSAARFHRRMIRGVLAVSALIAASLFAGVLGYRFTENMTWLDALLNSCMILAGEGPVSPLHTTGGKLFASFYAVYSGLFLIAAMGILLTPVFHRVLHKFSKES